MCILLVVMITFSHYSPCLCVLCCLPSSSSSLGVPRCYDAGKNKKRPD
jgi:hypothetical protein